MPHVDKYVSVTEAKNKLLDLIGHLHKRNEVLAITREGVPAAVLLCSGRKVGVRPRRLRKRKGVKRYRPRYTSEVATRSRTLHPEIKQEIREAVRKVVSSPHSGHELQYELSGYRSHRVRSCRILYQTHEDADALDVVCLGPRRTVYEQFKALLEDRTKGNERARSRF